MINDEDGSRIGEVRNGKVATTSKVQEVHCELRECLSENVGADVAASIGFGIIYEGSVNGAKCQKLIEQYDVDIPWVIFGHCEQRVLFNQSNGFAGDKVVYAFSQVLKVNDYIGGTLKRPLLVHMFDERLPQINAASTVYSSGQGNEFKKFLNVFNGVWVNEYNFHGILIPSFDPGGNDTALDVEPINGKV
ncbi:hypothetical protein V6N11_061788 [Hibiscus sabdariffa]|uniref:Uncharacterized protein n=1 Tax=Hibiscus sabdariffa TaxID=183260 RepID=A0ABR1ZUP3_9ROSI